MEFDNFVDWMKRDLLSYREIPTMGRRSSIVARWDPRQFLDLRVGEGGRTSGTLGREMLRQSSMDGQMPRRRISG